MEDISPLLDVALGLFGIVFGALVIFAARSAQEREGQDGKADWTTSALLLVVVLALAAGIVGGWAFAVTGSQQTLIQAGISAFTVLGASVAVWGRRRNRRQDVPLRVELAFFAAHMLELSGGAMAVAALGALLTFPLVLVDSEPMIPVHNLGLEIGVIAGFITIGFLLLSLAVAEQ